MCIDPNSSHSRRSRHDPKVKVTQQCQDVFSQDKSRTAKKSNLNRQRGMKLRFWEPKKELRSMLTLKGSLVCIDFHQLAFNNDNGAIKYPKAQFQHKKPRRGHMFPIPGVQTLFNDSIHTIISNMLVQISDLFLNYTIKWYFHTPNSKI